MKSCLPLASALLLSLNALPTSCNRPDSSAAPENPAAVPVQVSSPLPMKVTEYDFYSGRLEAVESVELRARVSGYLDQILFEAGAEVKKGQPLFIIDQRPYRNALNRAEAEVDRAQATLALAESERDRGLKLKSENVIATRDVEQRIAEAKQAKASLDAAKAALESAQLDLEFTEIKSPIEGVISEETVTVGNLIPVGTDGGPVLATIVTKNPIYVYIDADERSVIEYRESIGRGDQVDIANGTTFPFELGVIGQETFPSKGEFDYISPRINPSTGTLRVRGVVRNTDGLLSPGMFARVRVASDQTYDAGLVNEQAILTDQGKPFVYVVGPDHTIIFRPIETGPVREGLRVVKSGLTEKDKVIVAGVMRLRPGMKVDPRESPMPRPSSGDEDEGTKPSTNGKNSG